MWWRRKKVDKRELIELEAKIRASCDGGGILLEQRLVDAIKPDMFDTEAYVCWVKDCWKKGI